MVIGAEFSYLVCSLFVLESVQRKHLSVAAGVFTFLMSVGSAIGAAASSSIRQHVSGQEKRIEGFRAAISIIYILKLFARFNAIVKTPSIFKISVMNPKKFNYSQFKSKIELILTNQELLFQ